MPTLYGPWLGGDEARIELDYSANYDADHTMVHFNGTFYYATRYSVSDSSNSWSRWGDYGDASGSNVSIQHGSGGGRTAFHTMWGSWTQAAAVSVGAQVSGIQAQGGGSIGASFVLPTGPLAPTVGSSYSARDITANSFTTTGITANGNGGSLTNIAMQSNVSASESGSVYQEAGGWADITRSGLVGGTTYYFRIRVANNTWGWGPWGPWKSVTTLPDVQVKVAGVWKNATPYVNVNGTWKQADRWVKVNGVWKR